MNKLNIVHGPGKIQINHSLFSHQPNDVRPYTVTFRVEDPSNSANKEPLIVGAIPLAIEMATGRLAIHALVFDEPFEQNQVNGAIVRTGYIDYDPNSRTGTILPTPKIEQHSVEG